MPFCQNCGKKSLQESPHGPSGGSPFQTFVLRGKEEPFRHKEIDAIIGCVSGLIVFLASFVIRLPLGSGLTNLGLMVSGLFIIFISTISSQYYSFKQKNLMKTHS